MKPLSVGRFPHGLFLLSLSISILVASSAAQPALPKAPPAVAVVQPCCAAMAPAYLGAYFADGKFRANKQGGTFWGNDALDLRPAEVPRFMNLHPRERIIENYQPPARATKTLHRQFFLSGLRDDLLTLVYGRERALLSPQDMAVDSKGRIIVSDPAAGAVHVLDSANSFRITAGPNRRLHSSKGVAVDADDNIYVSDPDRGLVVVFGSGGSFLREIGRIENESLFHAPTAIAIDPQAARLYLLDTPRGTLFTLDLQGRILQRVGNSRGRGIGRPAGMASPLDLDQPTAIALGHGRLAVLDAMGSRVRILNLQCQLLTEFSIAHVAEQSAPDIGLAFDSANNLYVTNAGESSVRIYDQGGRLTGMIGRYGVGPGEFRAPSGLWIDASDRIYIADTGNRRVQVFQLPTATAHAGGSE